MARKMEQIVALYEERKRERHPVIQDAERVAAVYHDEITLPLPEVDRVDESAAANLTQQGVDAMGQRVASTLPTCYFEISTNTETGRARARDRRDAVLYWWDENMLDLRLGLMARHYVAYAACSLMIRPDHRRNLPEYVALDPLSTYPSGDEVHCEDSIMVSRKTRRWVRNRYDSTLPAGRDPQPSDEVLILEYVDEDDWVVVGRLVAKAAYGEPPDGGWVELRRFPNLAHTCPVAAAGRPGLKHPTSQFAGIIGMYIQQSILQSYELIGVRKSVLPEKWVVGAQGQEPIIVEHADAMTGRIGVISGGTINQLLPQPSQQVAIAEDRLERNARVQARLAPEFGGESGSNIRTGRRGDAILSAVVDFPVQEAQRWLQRLLKEANKIAIATDKAYWGGEQKKIWVSMNGIDREVTYDPSALWTTDRHTVTYAHPGTDANGLAVGLGQRVGMETMSKKTMMTLDPMVDDPEGEHDQVVYEKLEGVLLQAFEQRAATGEVPEADVAAVMLSVRNDRMELPQAIIHQQEIAQARQATQAPAGSPATQPGLANPGAGAEQPPVPPPPQSVGNLANMLHELRLPTIRQTPGELAGQLQGSQLQANEQNPTPQPVA